MGDRVIISASKARARLPQGAVFTAEGSRAGSVSPKIFPDSVQLRGLSLLAQLTANYPVFPFCLAPLLNT